MDMQELKSLIYQGEKVDIECKKAEDLPTPEYLNCRLKIFSVAVIPKS